ncbi:hypothetical protein NPIL_287881, partial [Nephila pilipes]
SRLVFKIGMMDIYYVIGSFVAILCVIFVIATDPKTYMSTDEILSMTRCVATSAKQELCDEFQKCFDLFPQSHKSTIKQCMRKIPGRIGKCTKNQELFTSERNRKKLYKCIDDQVPMDLTEEQKNQIEKVK